MRWIFPILLLVVLIVAPVTASVLASPAGTGPFVQAGPGSPVVASFTANPDQGSAPLEVRFTDTSTGTPTSWRWDFGDGGSSTERNPVRTYCSVGMYRVTLFAERAEPLSVSSETREITVLVGDEVVADYAANTTSGAAPLAVRFADRSINATRWSWTFGDGGTSSDQDPSHVYTVPGNHTVTLIAQNDYRMDSETKVGYISVWGPVTASFRSSSRAVDNGTPVQFTSTSAGNPCIFTWDFGDGATSIARDPSHLYPGPGTYAVSLAAANPFDADTRVEAGYITVYDEVRAAFTANTTRGPAPLPILFTDRSTGGPTRWSWDFGDGSTSTEQHPVHMYAAAGSYDVSLTAGNDHSMHTTTAIDLILAVWGPPAVLLLPGCSEPPADPDGDGVCEDLNANGRMDFADVVLYFNQMTWIAENEPLEPFDYNANGRIDFADVVWLFNNL